MGLADDKIRVFEDGVLLPSLEEISKAPRLLEDFDCEVVVKRPAKDAAVEELLGNLAGALRRPAGPSLALIDKRRPKDVPPLAGRYVVTAFYEHDGENAYASPGVMFWMRFNGKLHAFAHRYDNAVARHAVEKITRPHVLNHVLNSLSFYQMYVWSPTPFPGYR